MEMDCKANWQLSNWDKMAAIKRGARKAYWVTD